MKNKGHFDVIFIGAGASSSLLMRSMESRGLLTNKKIAVIDSDDKSTNDKTYCFWTSYNDPVWKSCQTLFSQSWDTVSVNRQAPEILENAAYVHISSLALYNDCRRMIGDFGISRDYSSVLDLKKAEDGVEILTNEGVFKANMVFDSRPPIFSKPQKNEVVIWQTFIGYTIRIQKELEYSNCIDLMDFNVPQDGFTQFMYILPHCNKEILVELTRFGSEPIMESEAEPILTEYIEKRFGEYVLTAIERGKIPMSTALIQREKIDGVIPIGGRSGAIKPSTGYAFKKMYQAAEHIANRLESKQEITALKSEAKRFEFYDRLLLLILFYEPTLGKNIFSLLFKKNRIASVFEFLEGRTSIIQDIRILLSLPFRPFLKVLRIELAVWFRKHHLPIFTLSLALLLLVVQNYASSYSFFLQVFIFTLGFILVGLPHGAVDYLLENGMNESGVTFRFVARYVGLSFAFLGVWAISSNCAVLFFLVYSMWHFGQCDFMTWFPEQTSPLKNTFWGFLLFGVILIGHQEETNMVLSSLNILKLPFSVHQSSVLLSVFVLLAFAWSFLERNTSFLLTVCMLFVGLWLPLMSAFSLYFIGQHSVNGWKHLKAGLQTKNTDLYLKSLPFNLSAIGLLALSYWLTQNYLGEKTNLFWLPLFFVFLSCISFPHIISMHRFYSKK